MNTKYTHILALFLITAFGAFAADHTLLTQDTPFEKSDAGSWEFTFGGSGYQVNDVGGVGLDFSVATNPFKALPQLWLGLNQGFSWDPALWGSTDVNANWSWHLWRDLYLNTGWSYGASYYSEDYLQINWRTGPEATFQYYFKDAAFVYAGVNYDLAILENCDPDGFRYSFGIGLAF